MDPLIRYILCGVEFKTPGVEIREQGGIGEGPGGFEDDEEGFESILPPHYSTGVGHHRLNGYGFGHSTGACRLHGYLATHPKSHWK